MVLLGSSTAPPSLESPFSLCRPITAFCSSPAIVLSAHGAARFARYGHRRTVLFSAPNANPKRVDEQAREVSLWTDVLVCRNGRDQFSRCASSSMGLTPFVFTQAASQPLTTAGSNDKICSTKSCCLPAPYRISQITYGSHHSRGASFVSSAIDYLGRRLQTFPSLNHAVIHWSKHIPPRQFVLKIACLDRCRTTDDLERAEPPSNHDRTTPRQHPRPMSRLTRS